MWTEEGVSIAVKIGTEAPAAEIAAAFWALPISAQNKLLFYAQPIGQNSNLRFSGAAIWTGNRSSHITPLLSHKLPIVRTNLMVY